MIKPARRVLLSTGAHQYPTTSPTPSGSERLPPGGRLRHDMASAAVTTQDQVRASLPAIASLGCRWGHRDQLLERRLSRTACRGRWDRLQNATRPPDVEQLFDVHRLQDGEERMSRCGSPQLTMGKAKQQSRPRSPSPAAGRTGHGKPSFGCTTRIRWPDGPGPTAPAGPKREQWAGPQLPSRGRLSPPG